MDDYDDDGKAIPPQELHDYDDNGKPIPPMAVTDEEHESPNSWTSLGKGWAKKAIKGGLGVASSILGSPPGIGMAVDAGLDRLMPDAPQWGDTADAVAAASETPWVQTAAKWAGTGLDTLRRGTATFLKPEDPIEGKDSKVGPYVRAAALGPLGAISPQTVFNPEALRNMFVTPDKAPTPEDIKHNLGIGDFTPANETMFNPAGDIGGWRPDATPENPNPVRGDVNPLWDTLPAAIPGLGALAPFAPLVGRPGLGKQVADFAVNTGVGMLHDPLMVLHPGMSPEAGAAEAAKSAAIRDLAEGAGAGKFATQEAARAAARLPIAERGLGVTIKAPFGGPKGPSAHIPIPDALMPVLKPLDGLSRLLDTHIPGPWRNPIAGPDARRPDQIMQKGAEGQTAAELAQFMRTDVAPAAEVVAKVKPEHIPAMKSFAEAMDDDGFLRIHPSLLQDVADTGAPYQQSMPSAWRDRYQQWEAANPDKALKARDYYEAGPEHFTPELRDAFKTVAGLTDAEQAAIWAGAQKTQQLGKSVREFMQKNGVAIPELNGDIKARPQQIFDALDAIDGPIKPNVAKQQQFFKAAEAHGDNRVSGWMKPVTSTETAHAVIAKEAPGVFDAHGMRAATVRELYDVLNSKFDKDRFLHTAKITQDPTVGYAAGGGTFGLVDGNFTLLPEPNKALQRGVGSVIVSTKYADSIPDMQADFPHIKFIAANDPAAAQIALQGKATIFGAPDNVANQPKMSTVRNEPKGVRTPIPHPMEVDRPDFITSQTEDMPYRSPEGPLHEGERGRGLSYERIGKMQQPVVETIPPNSAAVMDRNGKVFTGFDHAEAAQRAGVPYSELKHADGFVTSNGRYVESREEALAIARRAKQVPEQSPRGDYELDDSSGREGLASEDFSFQKGTAWRKGEPMPSRDARDVSRGLGGAGAMKANRSDIQDILSGKATQQQMETLVKELQDENVVFRPGEKAQIKAALNEQLPLALKRYNAVPSYVPGVVSNEFRTAAADTRGQVTQRGIGRDPAEAERGLTVAEDEPQKFGDLGNVKATTARGEKFYAKGTRATAGEDLESLKPKGGILDSIFTKTGVKKYQEAMNGTVYRSNPIDATVAQLTGGYRKAMTNAKLEAMYKNVFDMAMTDAVDPVNKLLREGVDTGTTAPHTPSYLPQWIQDLGDEGRNTYDPIKFSAEKEKFFQQEARKPQTPVMRPAELADLQKAWSDAGRTDTIWENLNQGARDALDAGKSVQEALNTRWQPAGRTLVTWGDDTGYVHAPAVAELDAYKKMGQDPLEMMRFLGKAAPLLKTVVQAQKGLSTLYGPGAPGYILMKRLHDLIRPAVSDGLDALSAREILGNQAAHMKYVSGNVLDATAPGYNFGQRGQVPYADAMREMERNGIVGNATQTAQEFQEVHGEVKTYAAKVGETLENVVRSGENADRAAMYAMRLRAGDSMLEAAFRVNKTFFDFSRKGPVVQAVSQFGIVPFATWHSKVIPFMMKWAVENPGEFMVVQKALTAAGNGQIPASQLPDYLHDTTNYITGVKKDKDGHLQVQIQTDQGIVPGTESTNFLKSIMSNGGWSWFQAHGGIPIRMLFAAHDEINRQLKDPEAVETGDFAKAQGRAMVGRPWKIGEDLLDPEKRNISDVLNDIANPMSGRTIDLTKQGQINDRIAKNNVKGAANKQAKAQKAVQDAKDAFVEANKQMEQAKAVALSEGDPIVVKHQQEVAKYKALYQREVLAFKKVADETQTTAKKYEMFSPAGMK